MIVFDQITAISFETRQNFVQVESIIGGLSLVRDGIIRTNLLRTDCLHQNLKLIAKFFYQNFN